MQARRIFRAAQGCVTPSLSCQRGLVSKVPSISFDISQPDQLENQLMQQQEQRPMVVTGALKQWEAMRWCIEDLKTLYGNIHIPVEVSYHGGDYRCLHTSEGSGKKRFEADVLVPFSLLLETMQAKNTAQQPTEVVLYAAQTDLLELIPQLAAGVQAPPLPSMHNRLYKRNTWLGPAGTTTPLHCDPYYNLFCQVMGSKYIRLYDRKHTQQLYPFGNHFLRNTSQVEVENVDIQRFPDFAQTPYFECKLEAGDMLFIPRKYWHYVRALCPSWSVSYWWT